MKKTFLLTAVLLFTFISCKDESNPVDPPSGNTQRSVVVINEGLFSQNNSSITNYNLEDKNVDSDVYSAANDNAKLGDTANDIVIVGNKGYISVDQSYKIEVVNINTFKSLGMIDLTNFGEPRHLCLIDSTAGYVTTYNDIVVHFDPKTLQIIETVNVGSKPEGIVNLGSNLFVANSGWGAGTTVSVIDISSFTVKTEITVKINPQTIVEDGLNVYVISTGSYGGDGYGMITEINPSSLTITDTLSIAKNPGKATVASNNQLLVINGNGLVRVQTEPLKITNEILIPGTTVNSLFGVIHSVTYDEKDDLIYLGNPKDFTQNGDVAIYDFSGVEKGRFDTGINPGTIAIKN